MTEEGCQNHAIVQYFTALLELTKTAFEKKNCYENDLEMSCLLKSEHQFWRSYDGLKLIVFTRKWGPFKLPVRYTHLTTYLHSYLPIYVCTD